MNSSCTKYLKKALSSTVSTLSSFAIAASPLMTARLNAAEILPTGGQVESGSATIGVPTPGSMQIDQTSDRAIIGWDGFSIGAGNQVLFNVPNANSATLNRVNGAATSTIAGQMRSNGQLYLINPNGILITPTGSVRTNAFIGSSLDISNSDFLTGKTRFKGKGSSADVINQGEITTEDGGVAVLMGGHVENSGSITANEGAVGLASGEDITVDLTGDGLLSVSVPTSSANQTRALIAQTGRIKANGGRVELKAAATAAVPSAAINVSGDIEANSVEQTDSGVSFGGDAPAPKPVQRIRKAPKQGAAGTIVVDGGAGRTVIDKATVSAISKSAKGGQIAVTGREVVVSAARLAASGNLGGGKIEIGGSYQGKGPVANAETTVVDAFTVIDASATEDGDGGDVVIWADNRTSFSGSVTATGGRNGGDGGNVEVSGKAQLAYLGTVNTLAPKGKTGNLLLDPYNITISTGADSNQSGFTATGSGSTINVTTLQTALASNNVTVSTGSSGAESGDINVNNAITWSANTTLTLTAAGAITLNATITNTGAASGLTLNASGTGGINTGHLVNSGTLTFNVANASATGTVYGTISGAGSVIKTGAGNLRYAGQMSYTGTTTINGGTLTIGTYTAPGGIPIINVNNGGTLAFGANDIWGSATTTSSAAITINSGGTVKSNGYFNTLWNLTLNGGTLNANGGVNSFFGSFQLPGTVTVTGASQIIASGAFSQINLGGMGNLTTTFNIAGASDSLQIAAALQDTQLGTTALTKSGAGTLTLTGANTYTGTTTISAGTLYLTNPVGYKTKTLAVSAGATLSIDNSSNGATTSSYGGNHFVFNTVDAALTGAGTVNFIGTNGKFYGGGSGGGTLAPNLSSGGQINILGGSWQWGFGKGAFTTNLGNLSIASGAELRSGDNAMQFNKLEGSGTIARAWSGDSVMTIGVDGGSSAFAGRIVSGDSYNGVTTGAISLIKAGAGTIVLNGANTTSGTTTISSGTLQVGDGGTTGTLGTGSIVNNANLVYSYSTAKAMLLPNTTNYSGSGNLTATAGGIYFSGNLALGTGALSLAATSTSDLGGPNSVDSAITAGSVNISGMYLGPSGTTKALTFDTSATNGAINITDFMLGKASVQVSYGTLGFNAGTGTITLAGTNTLNWWNGGATTTLSGKIAGSGSIGQAGGPGSNMSVIFSTPTGTNSTYSGAISGANIQVVKNGAGTLSLTGTNTYTPGTTINAGILNLGSAGALGTTGPISFGGGTLQHSAANTVDYSGRFSTAAGQNILIDTNGQTVTYAGALAGTGSTLSKLGAGTLILTGNNTYTGTTTISAGTLQVGNAGTTGTLGTGSIINNANLVYSYSTARAMLLPNTTNYSGSGNLTATAGGIYFSGNLALGTGALSLAATSTSDLGGPNSVDSAITAGSVNISGMYLGPSGTTKALTFDTSATNGAINITDFMLGKASVQVSYGTLGFNAGTGTITLAGTNTLNWWNGGATTTLSGNIAGSGSIGQAGAPGSNMSVIFSIPTGTNSTYSGAISGTSVQVVKNGAGTLSLTGTNTYTPGTTINAGILNLGSAGALGTSGPISFGGGTLQHSAANTVDYSGRFSTAAGQNILIDTNGQTVTYAGALAGTGSTLSKLGAGTLILTGANTYTGTTTVSAGTLTLSGSWNRGTGTATTVVASGATLNGTGVVTAATLAHSGAGTLALSGANMIDSLTTSGTTGSVSVKNAKSLSVGSISATSIALQTTGASSDLTIGTGAVLAASGTGTAVVLAAGRNFINNSGAGAITLSGTGGPNWQVYAASSVGNTYNNLDSGNAPVWGKTYGQAISDTGNRYIFANGTVTFTSVNDTKIYGNDATTALQSDYTVSGLGGVTGAYLATSSATAFTGAPVVTSSGAGVTANKGTYAITLAAGTLTAQNGFTLAYANSGVLTVNARPITVTADAKTMVYGNSTPSLTYVVGGSGLVNGDTLTGALATTASTTSNVGTYGITQGSLAASANYALTYAGANVTVGTRAITVTADAKTINYGNAIPALTYVVGGAGLVNGDTLSGAMTTPATNGSSVGTYAINQGTLAASANYAMTFAGNTLTIQPGTLTITANALNMFYGNAVPTLTYTVTGATLQANEFITGSLATVASSTSGVGTYSITQGTLAGPSNYAVTFVAGSLTINQRPITITADAKSMIYGNSAPSLSYVIGGSGLVNNDTLSGALATTASSTSNAGTYAITQGTVAASANYAITYVGNNVTVGQRAITVSADAKTMTYGDASPALTYAVGGLGLVNGDTLTGALATTASPTSNVGAYGITQGTVAASANYAITYVGNNVTVGQRAITVTADAKTMTYGNSIPNLTYAVGGLGLVNGDTLSGAMATNASSTSDVGTYGITQGTLASSGNYAMTYTGNNVTVGQRAITVSADAKTMIYGNSVPNLTFTVGGLGLVNGDTLTGALATSASSTSNVGDYGITQGTLASSGNYALTYAGNNVTVAQRAITVSADAKTMIYGNTVPSLTYAVGGLGLVNGDTLSGALSTTATSASGIGTYAISQNTLAASANYALTYAGNDVTVTPRALIITADAKSMIYGNSVPDLTYVIGGDGLVNGDTLTGALATTATSASNVGAYAITRNTLAASANYALTYVGGNVSITPRALTITADAKSMVYGNAVPELTYSTGGLGLVNGDQLSGSLDTTASPTANVGTHAITQGSVAASSNYAITYQGADVTINKRQITISADAQSMIYGNSVPTLTYTVGGMGLVNGDTLSGGLATLASSTANVGAYGITQGTLEASGNYDITGYTGNTVTIAKRSIMVTADAQVMAYGDAVPTLTYTVGGMGLVNNDILPGALATDATSSSNVGTYAITRGTLADFGNYDVTQFIGNSLTINRRAITLTADAQSMTYGNGLPTLTYTIGGAGLVNGDTLNGALATTASSSSNIGTYAITQGTLAASDNYDVTSFTNGALAIGKRAITIAANVISMTYGNAVPNLTYLVGGDGLAGTDQLTGALATPASPTSSVGNYAITRGTLAASANYDVTYTGNFVSVTPRPLTITADAKTVTYGNTVPALTYQISGAGLVNGDTLSGALSSAVTSTSNVGAYAIGVGTVGASGNYAVTYIGDNVTVAPRPVTVTAHAKTITYGNGVPTLTFTIGGDGLLIGDTVTGSLATTASPTSNVGAYAITRGNLAFSSNYDVSYTANTVTVNPRPITVTAAANTMTYGNAVPALTYTVGGSGLVNNDTLSGGLATTASSTSNVGTYGITQGTLSASSNYTVSYTGANVTVAKRILTVAADSQSMIYGDAVPTLTYTYCACNLVNGDTLTGNLASTASPTANVGTYAITQGSLAASSNYTLSFVGNNVTIGHRQITVTADTKTMSYGDSVPTLTYTVGGAGLVNGDTLTGALAAVATNTSGTGTYAINRGTLAAPLNYAMTFTGSNIVVGKRSVILSADAKTVTYGDSIPTLTVTVGGAGLANESDLTGALDTAARTGSNVGRYIITQGTLSLPSSNYDVTYQANDVNIVPRQIFVAANAQTMTYGDTVPNLTYTITDGTFLNSDGLSGALMTAASSRSSVGNYSIDRGSLTASPNYEIVYQGNSVTVQPRAITVSADAKSVTYGNVVPALTYVVGGQGLVNGDQLTGALSTGATSRSAAGDYSINQGSLAASSNYAVTYTGNTMTINKRAITIAANAQTMTYGDALPTLTYTVGGAGLVAGDQLTGALETAATSTSNVGAYGITIGSLAASPNYDVTFNGNNLTIGQRAITIRADAKTMTYGDALPNLTYTIGGQGLAGSDDLTGALSTAATSTSNTGIYSIYQGTLSASSNYAVSYVGDAVTIGKRALTITADAKTMTYGDALPALTYTLGGQGLVSGDSLSGAMVTTAVPSSHVGAYNIGQGSLTASSNYAVTFIGNNVTVGQRALTIAANSKTMTYGDAVPVLTYVIGGRGLVGSDALTGTLATDASATSDVGTYTIDRGSLSASSDYAVTYVGNTVTVGQRNITVTAISRTMAYGDAVPTLTYVVGGRGLAGTDTLSGALASTVSSTSNVGTYDITRGTLAASANYNLVFNSGIINVGRRAITVAADNKTITSGSALPSLTYSFTSGNLANGDLLNGALATSANASSPVGLYTIGQGSLSASNNYDLTFVTGALTISAAGSQPSDIKVSIPAASQALQTYPAPAAAPAGLPEVKVETASCSSSGNSSGDFVDLVSGMSVAGQMALGGCSAAN